MKSILVLTLAMCVAVGFARSDAPVTQDEAAAVFAKAEKMMKSVLRFSAKPPVFPAGSGTATRAQIVKHFQALVQVVQPKFKFTPPPQKAVPAVISFKDPATKQIAFKLEVLGFIDRYGPLATAKTDTMSPAEFGDAIGFFIARVADLTHTPSSKFSPYLSPG